MPLSKILKLSPRDVATRLKDALASDETLALAFEEPEIAGPGFINLKFKPSYLSAYLSSVLHRFSTSGTCVSNLPLPPTPRRVLVDYSSPNIAKSMHVGHLRSTVIGDCIANVLSHCGHVVLRVNHVGDWGTQFGMLVEQLLDAHSGSDGTTTTTTTCAASSVNDATDSVEDLLLLYRAAKKRFDEDAPFRERCRLRVVLLQSGDATSLGLWRRLCETSRREYQAVYDRLGVTDLQERGESFYNPMLAGVVKDMERQGLAVESEGATVVFLPGYSNKDGSAHTPLIIKKSDGGYNYATTDLAAVKHRTSVPISSGGFLADRVLYVTDAGQAQHFSMVFAAARLAGLAPPHASLEHVPFGLVQGADGKKLKTRAGDSVKLTTLLDEAVRIATEDHVAKKKEKEKEKGACAAAAADDDVQQLSEEETETCRIVGISAVKYADLAMNRESNYKFSFDKMLSLQGNTAPYMLSILSKLNL